MVEQGTEQVEELEAALVQAFIRRAKLRRELDILDYRIAYLEAQVAAHKVSDARRP